MDRRGDRLASSLDIRVWEGRGTHMRPLVVLCLIAASLPATLWGKPSITTSSLPNGVVGISYSASLQANGGPIPITWAIEAGELPAGLSLSSGGAISGTPAATGNSVFTVRATDSSGGFDSANLQISIYPAIVIGAVSLPPATLNQPYSQTLSATGGMPPFEWSIASGSLPPGMNLSPNGTISGTPSMVGTFSFAANVTDSVQTSATVPLQLSVVTPLVVATSALPAGMVAVPYSQTLGAAGGAGGYSWSITSGSLPAGLSLAPGGTIGGTPTASGTAGFTVQVTDSANTTATQPLSIAVAPATLSVSTTSLAGGTVGASYSQGLSASGGTGSYTWSISSGSLPAGLSLAPGGTIGGTPTASGTAGFTVQVTDSANTTATQPLSIAVAPAPLSVSTTSLAGGTVGTSYSQGLSASGGTGSYTWSITSGSLPAGLSLAGGTIGGTPTASGTASFTVQVTDSANTTATQPLSIAVAPATLSVSTTSLAGGTVGASYSQGLSATGGTGSYTWSVSSGSLPAGLSLAGGTIGGTPTAPGTASFTVQVTDSSNTTATQPLSIAVAPATLSVSTTSLAGGTVGASYSQGLSASGGTGSYTWSITSGSLPAGLSLAPGGTIGGTPTASGTANFTVQVTDSANTTATQPLSIAVAPAPLSVSTTSLPGGTVGTPYSQGLSASGGTGSYTWSITSGSLPAGLSLSPGGTIGGTPTASGTAGFTVQVTDSANTTATQPLSIAVAPAPLSVSTTSLAGGTVGTPYSQGLSASGGTGSYTWSVSSGSLPAGLSLAGGAIGGTPTAPGTASFTVQVTDSANTTATQPLSIAVAPAALSVSTTSLASGTVGTSYSQGLSASGGTGSYTWSVSSGSLPAGLSLAPGGAIGGTPTAPGTASFTVQVTDSANTTATQPLSIAVAPAPLSVSTTSLAGGTVGTPYSQGLSASGGTGSYTWSITSGSLPAGLSLAGGTIGGTPTAPGTASFTVQVTDSANTTATQPLSIAVAPAPLSVSTTSLSGGTVGTPYSQGLSASGGTGSYSWSISSGSLPAGLSLAGGAIGGTPTAPGTASFTVQVTDSANTTATQPLSIAVAPATLSVSTTSLAGGTVGTPYSQGLSASGGTGSYTWSVSSGSLPAGLSLAGGTIGGTPTAPGTASFTVQVTDSANTTATQPLSIAVAPAALNISTSSLPGGTVGASYSQGLSATGGTGSYTWSISSGSLPAGLSLAPGGAIGGTPTAPGTASFTVQVTDSANTTATQPLSIAVAPAPLSVSTTSLPGGTVGTSYSQGLSASGGTGSYSWSISSGSLPAGLSLAGGAIGGTPTAPGTASFTVQVTDSANTTATQPLSIAVAPAPLSVSTTSLAGGTVGTPYSQGLSASGGTGSYTWSVSTGSLPAGLSLATTGTISGTPTASGTASFTVQVTDSANTSTTKPLSIAVAPAALNISTSSLPGGTVGASYSQGLSASGGTGSYTWSVSTGSLPAGLSLATTGTISGTPTASGTASFTVQVTDSANTSTTKPLSIAVAPAALNITTSSLPGGTVGASYSQGLSATGGTGGYTWSVSTGGLPTGLSLSATGTISGTPTAPGTASFTVKVTDSADTSTTKPLSIAVAPAALNITTSSLPGGTVGASYSQGLSATGGTGSYTWSIARHHCPQVCR